MSLRQLPQGRIPRPAQGPGSDYFAALEMVVGLQRVFVNSFPVDASYPGHLRSHLVRQVLSRQFDGARQAAIPVLCDESLLNVLYLLDRIGGSPSEVAQPMLVGASAI